MFYNLFISIYSLDLLLTIKINKCYRTILHVSIFTSLVREEALYCVPKNILSI